jgi:RNA polymerase-binding transcription factor DksA
MVDREELERLRERLAARRKELIGSHRNLHARWEQLQEAEVEFEETAQKVSLSQDIDQLDERAKEELGAIDRSLAKMQNGTYGICAGCGKDISFKRLDILPYTSLCSQCAQEAEQGGSPSSGSSPRVLEEGLPVDYEGFSDEELNSAIKDTLERDGRVAPEELEITCRDGTVYLGGAVASEKQHQILLQLLEDVMGLRDVVDDVQIDRLLWQRPDRTKGVIKEKKTDEEVLLEGEGVDEDTIHSKKAGTPLSPSETILPEEEE